MIFQLLPRVLGADKHSPVVVVISPLNIIHKDQLEQLWKRSISACRLNICSNVDETTDEIGPYSIVLCHPEALLNTRKGQSLLTDPVFKGNVVAVVIDECHIIEKWYVHPHVHVFTSFTVVKIQ